jgi:competence protein ComEA
MTSRQRGAAWILGLVVLGRVLDRLDLPFEKTDSPTPVLQAPAASAPADTGAVSRRAALRSDSTRVPAAAPERMAAERIAINRASAEELRQLPRVGPVLAARIVAWREAHGPLRGVDDLQKIQGIGANTAARLAPLVRFD